MKKLIAAIVIASIGASFASTVVYDYKASIKRLDLSMKKGTIKVEKQKYTTVLQKFSVKSDTIQGYVRLNLCDTCDADGAPTSLADSRVALNDDLDDLGDGTYAYLTLKGDKYSKVIARPEYKFYDRTENAEGYKWMVYPANNGTWQKVKIAENGAVLQDFAAAPYNFDLTDVDEWIGPYVDAKNMEVDNKGYYLYVLKTPIEARTAIFGADQILRQGMAGSFTNPKANNKAWMSLDFHMPAIKSLGEKEHLAEGNNKHGNYDTSVNPPVPIGFGAIQDFETAGRLFSAKTGDPNGFTLAYLGFLGVGNDGFGSDYLRYTTDPVEIPVPTIIQNTGFGTVKTLTETEKSSYICIDNYSITTSCNIINTISGTLVGYPHYFGICFHTPMWDMCYEYGFEHPDYDGLYLGQEAGDAVISGTWTLKYNKTLSTVAETQKEDEILKKFKTDDKHMYMIDEDGNLVTPSSVQEPELYHVGGY